MYSALDIADAFVSIFKYDEDGITNLKVQKLLYFAQGLSYQRFGVPMFREEIEAWGKGPVVNCVYAKYAKYGNSPITESGNPKLSPDAERIVLDVAREFGKYTTNELINQTHAPETPWTKVFVEGIPHIVIPKEMIRDYFVLEMQKIPDGDEVIDSILDEMPVIDLREDQA